MFKQIKTSKLIKGFLGMAMAAGTFAATTGCDENDVKMLNALSGVIGSGIDSQGTNNQTGNPNVPGTPKGNGGGSDSTGGGYGYGGGSGLCGCSF